MACEPDYAYDTVKVPERHIALRGETRALEGRETLYCTWNLKSTSRSAIIVFKYALVSIWRLLQIQTLIF